MSHKMSELPKNSSHWIQKATKKMKKGALHKELGVKEGKKIPEEKLDKALHSKDKLLKKRAVFANNMRKAREE